MLTPVGEVRDHILGAIAPLPAIEVPVAEALGCVAAVAVTAPADVPPFANSAMDGFAVRSVDTVGAPVQLQVVGLLAAGAAPDRPVGPGEALRIMTGAPMPEGADSVVMVERTTPVDEWAVVIEAAATPGQHVRAAGTDAKAGQEVIAAGTVLTPAHLGVVASVGQSDVTVHRRPAVGVLSTGNELVEGPAVLRPGQIYDANRPMLLALITEAGCRPVDLGWAPDDADAISDALATGLTHCDAVVVTGGVSVGDFDYVAGVLGRFHDARSWQVAMKPGKPLAWGTLGGKPMFGLPGNPVSAAVSFEVFARPALRRLAGDPRPLRPVVAAVAAEPFRRRADGKLHLVRVVAEPGDEGRLHARSAGGQDSHMLGALAAGNALALLPDGEGVDAGAAMAVLLLGPA
ncbi:MAG: molybdopterin molybdotransferase MoeA [Acidimicrobiales bacterium]